MRPSPLILALLLVTSTAARAGAQGPSVGFSAGFGWSTISSAGLDARDVSQAWRPGLNGGLYAVLPLDHRRLSRTVAVQPELPFVQKGLRAHNPQSDTLTRGLEYLELPLLLRAGTTGRAPGLFALAGPGLSLLLRSHGEVDAPETRRVDLNAIAGVGVATGEFSIEARFDAGLRRLQPDALTAPQRTRTISAIIRIRF